MSRKKVSRKEKERINRKVVEEIKGKRKQGKDELFENLKSKRKAKWNK